MNRELEKQSEYWDKEVNKFDAIYSHDKSTLGVLLDKFLRWDMYERFEYTMKNAEPIEGRTFLDVGCGTGRYSLELAKKNAGFILGIDISGQMIGECKKRAENMGLADRVAFVQTDLLNFEPRKNFDVCIGMGLFDYIRNPLPVLEKMRTCIRDRVILSFPSLWTWKAPVRKLRLSLNNCDVFFYTRGSLEKILRSAGFQKFIITKIGQLYCVTAMK